MSDLLQPKDGPEAEVHQLGEQILSGGISMANQLASLMPERCETIEVKKHPWLENKAQVSNGGDAGTIDVAGIEFPEGHWSVSVYESTGHLPQTIRSRVTGKDTYLNDSMVVTVQIPTEQGPVRVKAWEKEREINKVSDTMQENLNIPNSVKPAEIDNAAKANELVKKVNDLLKEHQVVTT